MRTQTLLALFVLLPVRAFASDAEAAYDAKDFARCAQLYEADAARQKGSTLAGTLYNAACCHALAGRADLAFKALDRAKAAGLRDAKQLLGDEDLAALRKDARWAKLVGAVKQADEKFLKDNDGELRRLFEEDQADRRGAVDWKVVNPRDERRRRRVVELLALKRAKTAMDYFHAAMVFQHGETVEEIARANELASKAVELDPSFDGARWLAAASKDRWLMRQHKPQLYGTQFHREGDGGWELYEVDPTVTDEERAKWNVPPLEEARKRVVRMNAPPGK